MTDRELDFIAGACCTLPAGVGESTSVHQHGQPPPWQQRQRRPCGVEGIGPQDDPVPSSVAPGASAAARSCVVAIDTPRLVLARAVNRQRVFRRVADDIGDVANLSPILQ